MLAAFSTISIQCNFLKIVIHNICVPIIEGKMQSYSALKSLTTIFVETVLILNS